MAGFDGEAMPNFSITRISLEQLQVTQLILARQSGQCTVLALSINHTDANSLLLINTGPRKPGSLSCKSCADAPIFVSEQGANNPWAGDDSNVGLTRAAAQSKFEEFLRTFYKDSQGQQDYGYGLPQLPWRPFWRRALCRNVCEVYYCTHIQRGKTMM